MEYHGFDPSLSAYSAYASFPYLPCPPGVPPPSFYHHWLAHSQATVPGPNDPLHSGPHNPTGHRGAAPGIFHPSSHPNNPYHNPIRPAAMTTAAGFHHTPSGQMPLMYNLQDQKYPLPAQQIKHQQASHSAVVAKPAVINAAANVGNNSPSTPNVKTPTAKTKKKNTNSENNKKRKEFSELAKARTEKLMNDGPAFHQASPASQDSNQQTYSRLGPQQGTTSAATSNAINEATLRRNLMEDVLNMKKLELIKSPEVILALRTQQRKIEEQKRES